jgi:hypothetical protein
LELIFYSSSSPKEYPVLLFVTTTTSSFDDAAVIIRSSQDLLVWIPGVVEEVVLRKNGLNKAFIGYIYTQQEGGIILLENP